MKKFPKVICVVSPDIFDKEDFDLIECTIYENQHIAVEGESEGTRVAIYELKKQGVVKTTSKVVFE